MSRKALKCILGVAVVAAFFALTWSTTAARLYSNLTTRTSKSNISAKTPSTKPVLRVVGTRSVPVQDQALSKGGTITTDKLDYQPGDTVTVTGNHWLPGETVHLRYEPDSAAHTPHEVDVVADAAGKIYSREYTLTEADRGVAFYLTATGRTSGDVATRMFSDPNITTNLDQIQNGTPPPTDAQWSNGNINGQNSVYHEGDSVPFRYFVTGVGPNETHSFTIQAEWTKGGQHAYDYFTNFARTEGTPGTTAIDAAGGPCGDVGTEPPNDCGTPLNVGNFPNPANPANWDFTSVGGVQPADFFPNTFSVDGTPVDLRAYNVQSVLFSAVTGAAGKFYSFTGTATNREINIRVTFTTPANLPADSSVGFFWGGHLSIGTTTAGDTTHWGVGNGSGSISGAPFHMRAIDFDNDGRKNQDRSIQPGAIVACPTCDVGGDSGPVCPGETNTYTSTITGTCSSATHVWTVTGNGTIVGPNNGTSVQVMAGTDCGATFTITDTVTCSECPSPGISCSRVVTVDDDTPPTITNCPTGSDLGCNPTTLPTCDTVKAAVTATDDCGTPTINCSSSDDLVGCILTRTFTITAVDACGNTSQPCIVTYTWKVDTTDPVFTGCPTATIDLGCNPSSLPTCTTALALVTATDTCDGAITPTCSAGDVVVDGCFRTRTFTLTATDSCGNDAQCLVTYRWKVDTTDPVFTGCPTATIDLGCNPSSLPTCTTALALVTATDNCDGAITPTCSPGAVQSDGCFRTQTFTLTATDSCGNDAQCLVTYRWKVDTTDPVFTGCPTATIDLGCNPTTLPTCTTALALVTANDNCDGPITPTCSAGDVVADGCFRTLTFTLTATDSCGNDAQCLVTYRWKVDTTDPVFSGCPTETIDLGCNPSALPTCTTALALVTATDNCDGAITPTCSPGAVQYNGCIRTQTFTLTATDSCGNDAQCLVTYRWKVDTTDPVFSGCPTGIIDLGCNPSALPSCTTALALVTASDNCDGAITPTCSAGAVQYDGCFRSQTFTLTATDSCGNDAQCLVTYRWKVDTTKPQIQTCPTGANLGCNPTSLPTCATVSSLVVATDNCGAVTKNCGFVDSTNGCVVTRTFTVTATDGCGNTSDPCYVVYTWTVDTTKPTITCPPDKILTCTECEEEGGTDPDITGRPEVSDNCAGQVTVTYTDSVSGTCPKTITRTWKAVDACGNENTCVQRITCTTPSLVTNSSLCTFDFDPSTPCKDFRLIYTQDPQNMPNSKLTASNPGQFFYNWFYTGTPGTTANFTVTIPYPFETQGANPIHAYDMVTTATSNGETCLTPGNSVPFTASLQTFTVDCDSPVASKVIEISAVVPATGSLYVNIHLDYGLKGCGGYTKGGPSGNDAVNPNTLAVLIADRKTYSFSVSGSTNDDDSVCSINAFKRNPGVAGLSLRNLTDNPISGLTVTLKSPNGQGVGSSVTDLDGFYQINYKHTGKNANYTVTIVTPTGQQITRTVSLKANGFVQVDFTIP